MATMNSSSATSQYTNKRGPAVNMDASITMVKIRGCNHCSPPKLLEVRMSSSDLNPRRLYYKCRFCEEFDWIYEEDVIRGNFHEVAANVLEIGELKEEIRGIRKYLRMVVKLALVLYFVILVILVGK